MNLRPHTWQTYFRADPVIINHFIINYTLNMKTKCTENVEKIIFKKSVMQRLTVLGTRNARTEFALSNTDFTMFRGHSNASQQKSPLLNNVFRHTFRRVVIQMLCTLRLRTHRYYGALLTDWDTAFRSRNPLSDTVTWNNLQEGQARLSAAHRGPLQ